MCVLTSNEDLYRNVYAKENCIFYLFYVSFYKLRECGAELSYIYIV